MPIVTVHQSTGRTAEQKRRLVAGITAAFVEAYGLKPESVTVFLQDYDEESWGKEGRLQADRVGVG